MKMVKGFESMLAGSLDLEEPWYITGAEFNPVKNVIDVYVGIREDAVIACPHCGGPTKRYGYEPTERSWRHADCLFYPCYVHCKRPRVKCDNCGVQQVTAPFERQNSRHTLLFEGYAMMIMADVPRRKASRLLRCNEKTLASILSYWVNQAVEALDLSDVTKLAIDETSRKRGHDYVTVTIDAMKRRVFDVQDGRKKEAVTAMRKKLERHGGKASNIAAVTSDMSKSYLPGVRENFPDAEQIIDKFHVKKVLTDALDKVRKQEQKETNNKKDLFLNRHFLMTPQSRMNSEQLTKLAALSKAYPKTGRTFRIVQALDLFYASKDDKEAAKQFKQLYSWMRRSRLTPMKDAAETLMNHEREILHYFHERLTNAVCEGINSMIQAAKRKARGYNTFEGFAAMIYLVAGKLELPVPDPF